MSDIPTTATSGQKRKVVADDSHKTTRDPLAMPLDSSNSLAVHKVSSARKACTPSSVASTALSASKAYASHLNASASFNPEAVLSVSKASTTFSIGSTASSAEKAPTASSSTFTASYNAPKASALSSSPFIASCASAFIAPSSASIASCAPKTSTAPTQPGHTAARSDSSAPEHWTHLLETHLLEKDVIDLSVDGADTLQKGDFLRFKKSSHDHGVIQLQIGKIEKLNEIEWKVYFDAGPEDEKFVTTLCETQGRRFQKVGTWNYVNLNKYNFVPCEK